MASSAESGGRGRARSASFDLDLLREDVNRIPATRQRAVSFDQLDLDLEWAVDFPAPQTEINALESQHQASNPSADCTAVAEHLAPDPTTSRWSPDTSSEGEVKSSFASSFSPRGSESSGQYYLIEHTSDLDRRLEDPNNNPLATFDGEGRESVYYFIFRHPELDHAPELAIHPVNRFYLSVKQQVLYEAFSAHFQYLKGRCSIEDLTSVVRRQPVFDLDIDYEDLPDWRYLVVLYYLLGPAVERYKDLTYYLDRVRYLHPSPRLDLKRYYDRTTPSLYTRSYSAASLLPTEVRRPVEDSSEEQMRGPIVENTDQGMASSRTRAQPARQARNNPMRGSLFSFDGSVDEPPAQSKEPGFFPAIQSFTDAASALPREIQRHFTLLKEVDAKAHAQDNHVRQLLDLIRSLPAVQRTNTIGVAEPLAAGGTAPSVNGSMHANVSQAGSVTTEAHGEPDNDDVQMKRRFAFGNLRYLIQESLMTLDEKNHVISNANETLGKYLDRMDNVWPYVQGEISDEAKWGSTEHWAYKDKSAGRLNGTTAGERSRRDVAATKDLAAAAAALNHEEVVSSRGRGRDANEKKGGTSAPGNITAPPKRRKIEKTANPPVGGGVPMERALSGVFGSNQGTTARGGSPRQTPAPEPRKRGKPAAPALPAAGRKRAGTNTSAAGSPTLASSPLHHTFAATKEVPRSSPAAATVQRPQSSRARHNSAQSIPQDAPGSRQRPPSAASNKAKPTNGHTPTGLQASVPVVTNGDGSAPADTPMVDAPKVKDDDREINGDTKVAGTPTGVPKNVPPTDKSMKREGTNDSVGEKPSDSAPPAIQTMTRTGRTSKPPTPVATTFPVEPTRARSSRGSVTEGGVMFKRSHKKGGGLIPITAPVATEDAGAAVDEDEELEDDDRGDEPTYCYCNQVSYGEMIACDADDCPREWFHLSCVGLKKAPTGAKWYCDDCKENMRLGRNGNGR